MQVAVSHLILFWILPRKTVFYDIVQQNVVYLTSPLNVILSKHIFSFSFRAMIVWIGDVLSDIRWIMQDWSSPVRFIDFHATP